MHYSCISAWSFLLSWSEKATQNYRGFLIRSVFASHVILYSVHHGDYSVYPSAFKANVTRKGESLIFFPVATLKYLINKRSYKYACSHIFLCIIHQGFIQLLGWINTCKGVDINHMGVLSNDRKGQQQCENDACTWIYNIQVLCIVHWCARDVRVHFLARLLKNRQELW